MAKAKPQQCAGCGESFPSRNAVFKHLREVDGKCLSGQDYTDFCKYIRKSDKGVKVLILFGYIAVPDRIRNGDDAATILLQACQKWQDQVDGISESENETDQSSAGKYNRSYGNSQRALEVVAQDDDTGAVTEVLTTRLPALRGKRTIDEWVKQVQEIIDGQFSSPCPVRLLGRQDIPTAIRFNAEMDSNHRRIEYLLPVDFISWNTPEFKDKLEALPPFLENNKNNLNHTYTSERHGTHEDARKYLFKLKKLMQSLTTQIVDVDLVDEATLIQKEISLQKRKNTSKKREKGKKAKKETQTQENSTTMELNSNDTERLVTEQHKFLKRRRFHNFSPTVMAHEYLAFRRMDRLYHRATVTFPSIDPSEKPFIVLSVTGDLFLTGQFLRVVGVFLALANHLIDSDIVDCLFDENYPHLIPTPAAPKTGMVAAEARYMTWEGKLKSILSPRNTDRYPNGWNQKSTLERVDKWHNCVHEEIAKQWLVYGRDDNGRLNAEKEWTRDVLLPWVEDAKRHLGEYRLWRKTKNSPEAAVGSGDVTNFDGQIPALEMVDSSVPEVYKEVLHQLRKVDQSGQWPTTTPKRQLVMVSTAETEEAKEQAATSLSVASIRAKSNNENRSSAYDFAEGQGGASGSFSVGLMPGINKQPKSNSLFPELVKAAFELERVLYPNREPSSTIAINRNAQFRPHTDSGAGAGQSTSLIVGLGTYSGGELMVEGEKQDIRYKAIEFNGWKQRHWTMPFIGERYSLVWFTPKGCEGMRGINLDLGLPSSPTRDVDAATQ